MRPAPPFLTFSLLLTLLALLILLSACTPLLTPNTLTTRPPQNQPHNTSQPTHPAPVIPPNASHEVYAFSRYQPRITLENGTRVLTLTLPNPCYTVRVEHNTSVGVVSIIPPPAERMCVQVLTEKKILLPPGRVILGVGNVSSPLDTLCQGLEGRALQACCDRVMTGMVKPACIGQWEWRNGCAWTCSVTPLE